MRKIACACALILIVAACGDSTGTSVPEPAGATTTSPADPTDSTTTPTTTLTTTTTTEAPPPVTSTTAVPTTTTTTTGPPPEFTVAALGRNPDRSLTNAPTLGSGCSPGSDDLPDGAWFGWVDAFDINQVEFDLACLWPGRSWDAASNDSRRIRTVAVASGARVFAGDDPPVAYDTGALATTDWKVANAPGLPDRYPFWLFINDGAVTEVAQYPDAVRWAMPAGAWPDLMPGCCDGGTIAPPSPAAAWPADGWPADGFYATWVEAQTNGASELTLWKWLRCTANPGLCPEWWTGDEVIADNDGPSIRRTLIHDDEMTAVILPIFGDTALVGDGEALQDLLDTMAFDVRTWIEDPDTAPTWEELEDRSADPDFPFGMAYWPGTTEGLIGYRGPGGSHIMWDFWWHALEIRDGAPILYAHAGLVAG